MWICKKALYGLHYCILADLYQRICVQLLRWPRPGRALDIARHPPCTHKYTIDFLLFFTVFIPMVVAVELQLLAATLERKFDHIF